MLPSDKTIRTIRTIHARASVLDRFWPAIGLFGLLVLPFGCATVHQDELRLDHETGARIAGAPAGASLRTTLSPGSTAVPEAAPGSATGLHRVSAAEFRTRALAQQRIIRGGAKNLSRLAGAHAVAGPGSHRALTLVFLIEQVQRRQPPSELAHELTRESGIRQLAAVRAAAAHGAALVPALLTLVVHRDRDVRREAIFALRSITDRHPATSGHQPVHAIRIWRAWFDGAPPKSR